MEPASANVVETSTLEHVTSVTLLAGFASTRPGYPQGMGRAEGDTRCPICGEGTLVDVVFDEAVDWDDAPRQDADSPETSVYSCGHEVRGPSLATADSDALAVERRRSQDTVDGGAP